MSLSDVNIPTSSAHSAVLVSRHPSYNLQSAYVKGVGHDGREHWPVSTSVYSTFGIQDKRVPAFACGMKRRCIMS